MSDWISVDDRLPDTDAAVLIFYRSHVDRRMAVSRWVDDLGKHWRGYYGYDVTHWMPLPEAPAHD